MANGGFDPVAVMAHAGDSLTIRVEVEGGGLRTLGLTVPLARAPVVVRTEPPPRKRDVPLNASVVIVFSEPMSVGTVGKIQLLHSGAAVSGTVTLAPDGLRVTFQPGSLLDPSTDYVLSVPTGVSDASGDHLRNAMTSEFTTGTTTAVASVSTATPALFVNPTTGLERTFESDAVLGDDGRVTGTWSIFYAGSGERLAGRVTCFAIVDGKAAWVAGVADTDNVDSPSLVGAPWGWRVVDNGSPESGVPDELSLALSLGPDSLGTAQRWCATTPVSVPPGGEIAVYAITSGDLVVSGNTPPPPPPPPPPGAGMSQIAYARYPSGGIEVRNADGSGVRTLTTARGDGSPAWSPDGLLLAFASHPSPGPGDIWVMSYAGLAFRQVTSGIADDRDPAWSPDGAVIAFARDGAIQVMRATDGSGMKQLTARGPAYHPAWSPDGTKIAFALAFQIYVINADGSGLTQLTSGPGYDDTPAWSPDGTKIAFQHVAALRDSTGAFAIGTISVMNADGTGITRLTPGQTPAWSPDGKVIVYEMYGLYTINPDGTGTRFLSFGFTPAWSPVGTMPVGSGPVVTAPSNATAVTLSTTAIGVSWQDHATNETGFEIHRSATGPNGTFDLRVRTGANVTSVSDTGLTEGGQYCYRLRALQMSADTTHPAYSAYSNTACATTLVPASTSRR